MSLQLVIGNKNYSSWSLRPWLLLEHFAVPYQEIRIPLFVPGYEEELARYSPSLKVPVLIDEELTIWESMAICEYVNDNYLDGKALPASREARALCRSFCHEMHAGFTALRSALPMNCRALKRIELNAEVKRDIARIDALWTQGRRRFVGLGDYLFGRFSLADCMYAPVVMRFHTYGIELGADASAYVETLRANPALNKWLAASVEETEVLPRYEVGADRTV